MKSGKENCSKASYTITREEKIPNMEHDGRMKLAQVDANIELLVGLMK